MITLTHRARWRRLASLFGVPGLMGLTLGAVALWGWLAWLPQVQVDLADQQDQVAHLRQQLTSAGQASVSLGSAQGMAPGLSAEEADDLWRRLWASLPDATSAVALQGDLLAAAASSGAAVQAVQYRGAAMKGLPGLWRQQLVIPMELPYPALRTWLGWLLQQPAVSVDAVDIARSDPMGEVVRARVQISVWWRTGPGRLEGPR